MDVLIVERDDLMAEVLANALADEGLSTVTVPDEHDAATISPDDAPSVVITGMNGRGEDMKGMAVARRLCERWQCRGIIYLAALWPSGLGPKVLADRERFLAKPISLTRMTSVVRELLDCRGGNRHQPG
jgi:DNA-binding response OmpR family regulator